MQGSSYKLQSKALGEERNISIRLPQSYQGSKKDYPVLYLTDGENHFGHGVSAVSVLEEYAMMPETIIVAIPNLDNTRLRDLVYESNNFINFIENELKPFINSNFRTTGTDILFGHSSAGGFTLNMLRNQTELFDGYISASPSISMKKERVQQYKDFLKSQHGKADISLYIAMGGKADEGVAINPDNIEYLLNLLKNNAPDNISWTYDHHPEQNHMTSPYLALFRGLSWVFRDYQFPAFLGYQDFKSFGGIDALKVHFETRHENYQTPREIPEDVLVGLGFTFINEESYDQAYKILNNAIGLYPASYSAYNALGTLYKKQKRLTKALDSFENALTLAKENSSPHLSYFRKQVETARSELEKS
jgi:predicted alpha/beta superfamily hydrolase